MPITIKDVARVAGVTHPTVSRALRGHPAVAQETAARIHKIAEELGYRPNSAARTLKTNRYLAVGVIVSQIDDPFFSQVLQGIEDILRPAGYSMFVAASHRDLNLQKDIFEAMSERRVDGVIICSTLFSQEHGRRLIDYGLPVVVVNNQAMDDYPYSIYHDDRTGSAEITRYLLGLGHRRIAYLANIQAGRTSQDRFGGFLQEMWSAGLSVDDTLIFQGSSGLPESGLEAAVYFGSLSDPPTAIICFNDMTAIGLVRGFRNAGLRIPEDVSVVGFDNIALSAYITPALTTYDQPKYDLGQESAKMILDLLQNGVGEEENKTGKVIVLKGKLLVRESTAPRII